MKVKLSEQTGTISYGAPKVLSESCVERDAIFCYEGKFVDMDGNTVNVTADKLRKLATRHNATYQLALAKATEAGKTEVDAADCPPVQVDHSTSGWDTVGRIFGMLRLVDGYVPRPGAKPVVALAGPVRFLGKDNVERATDGRWATLSTAADFDEGYFTELTVTPFPAAKSARLLKQGKLSKYVEQSHLDGKWYVMDPDEAESIGPFNSKAEAERARQNNLSEAKMDKEKLKRHLAECKKMSADEAEKHLAALSEEETKKLAAEADEHEKKLAADKDEAEKKLAADKADEEKRLADEKKKEEDSKLAAETARTTRLAAAKTNFVKLAKEARSSFSTSRIEARKDTIVHRLASLRSKKKITPAEIKAIDLVKLSAKSDDQLEAFFEGFELREDVVLVGQRGTAKAEPVARLAKERHKMSSKQERLSAMPFTGQALAAKYGMEKDAQTGAVKLKAPAKLGGMDPTAATGQPYPQGTDGIGSLQSSFADICKMLDEGKREDALRQLKEFMSSRSALAESPAEVTSRLSALAERNKKLENQFEEMVKLVSSVLEVGEEELTA